MFVPASPMDFPCNYDWVKHVLAKMEILIEQTEQLYNTWLCGKCLLKFSVKVVG